MSRFKKAREAIKAFSRSVRGMRRVLRNSQSQDWKEFGDEVARRTLHVSSDRAEETETVGGDGVMTRVWHTPDEVRRNDAERFFSEMIATLVETPLLATATISPVPRREFHLTNEIYHLIMDCTEIVLGHYQTNNLRPDYEITIEDNGRFVDIGVTPRRAWSAIHHYRLKDRDGLPGLEEFLKRAFE